MSNQSRPNEALRYEKLRAQDGKPLMPPPNLVSLVKGGGLDPAKAEAARAQWEASMTELQAAPSFPAEERLFWLAFMLARHYAAHNQESQAGQLLAQTVPLLQQPRHSQVLIGTHARIVAGLGRMREAEELLTNLDPYSDDLQVDTNYRFSHARVAAGRSDHRAVLQALGSNIDDVPISDAYDMICGVLRANAHEQLGASELACDQLAQIAGSPAGLANIDIIVGLHPELGLVRHSLPVVRQRVKMLHENAIQTESGINVLGLVIGPLLAVPIGIGGFALGEQLDPPLDVVVPTTLLLVTIVGSIVYMMMKIGRGAARRKQLQLNGVEGRAQLMVVEQTGTRVNNQPMIRLRMIVTLPNEQPYSVVHNEIVPQIRLAQVQAGANYVVRVDPKDKRQMVVVWP